MRSLKISAFILLITFAIIGQTNKGGISGTVSDPNGAVVPGAKVTITNDATKETLVLTTSDSGVYIANNLDPAIQRARRGAEFQKISRSEREGEYRDRFDRQCCDLGR